VSGCRVWPAGIWQGNASGTFMRSLNNVQLARLTSGTFDVPPRTRNLLLVAGLVGLVLVVTRSLVGHSEATLPVDKIIHFSGYFVLGAVVVLGLRPRLFIPVLVGLAAVGLGVEYLQPLNGRTFDWNDAAANALGVAIGGAVGLLARALFAYVRQELAVVAVRGRLVHFKTGDVILRQGEPVREFFVISRGEVTLTREADGAEVGIGRVGPGHAMGVIGVVRGEPQFCSVRATSRGSFVRMTLDDLLGASGGRENPVGAVIAGMADGLCSLGERVARCRCEIT
jgi:VanZ family protein